VKADTTPVEASKLFRSKHAPVTYGFEYADN